MTAVSVVMPAYNAAAYLREAVGSVLGQSVTALELLIVDDASTDDTAAIGEALAAADSRVRLLRAEKNGGVSAARNLGVAAASHDWIAFLDSDDLWREDKLARQLTLLAERPGTDMVYTGYRLLRDGETAAERVFHVPETATFRSMLKKNVMSTSGMLMRRELLLASPFRGDVAHEDLFQWLTLLARGASAAGIDEPLHTVRVSRRESRSGNKLRAARERMRLYRLLGLSAPESLYYWLCYAGNALRKYAGLRF